MRVVAPALGSGPLAALRVRRLAPRARLRARPNLRGRRALAGACTAITSHAGALDALLLGSAVVAHGASRYTLRVHDALERAGAGAPVACVLVYSAGTRPPFVSARAPQRSSSAPPSSPYTPRRRTPPPSGSSSASTRSLAARLGDGYRITSTGNRPPSCDMPHLQTVLYGLIRTEWRGACEALNVRLRDGEQLHLAVLPPRSLVLADTDYRAVLALFFLSIAILAYLVARMTTRPLKQLAQAAQDLGNDINRAPLELTGASEIRQASAAFNAMQARIRQYIFQRTQMLAAITHDLQTPLTRMRLRLEKVADPEATVERMLDLTGLSDRADDQVAELSGGNRQRVNIAVGLLGDQARDPVHAG